MQGFKLKESKILRKLLSDINKFNREIQHSSEAKVESPGLNQAFENSNRSFSYHQDTIKYENQSGSHTQTFTSVSVSH